MREPIDRCLRAWLYSNGSLTRRLVANFGTVRVEPVRQRAGAATREEWRALGVRGARRVHVREVVLWGDGRPLVLARSVLPAVQAGLAWRAVRGLGTRPLADLLFGERAVRRHRLGLVHQCVRPASALRRQARATTARIDWPARDTWGRRALFVHLGSPLLLTEWFSPVLSDAAPSDVRGRPGRCRPRAQVQNRGA
jgi:chorismate--pyruvate lyase